MRSGSWDTLTSFCSDSMWPGPALPLRSLGAGRPGSPGCGQDSDLEVGIRGRRLGVRPCAGQMAAEAAGSGGSGLHEAKIPAPLGLPESNGTGGHRAVVAPASVSCSASCQQTAAASLASTHWLLGSLTHSDLAVTLEHAPGSLSPPLPRLNLSNVQCCSHPSSPWLSFQPLV